MNNLNEHMAQPNATDLNMEMDLLTTISINISIICIKMQTNFNARLKIVNM